MVLFFRKKPNQALHWTLYRDNECLYDVNILAKQLTAKPDTFRLHLIMEKLTKFLITDVGNVVVAIILGVGITHLISFVYLYGLGQRHSPEWIVAGGMAFSYGWMQTNPIRNWRGKQKFWRIGARFVGNFLIVIIVFFFIKEDAIHFLSIIVFLLGLGFVLCIPAHSALERFIKNTDFSFKERIQDAVIEYIEDSVYIVVVCSAMAFYVIFDWFGWLSLQTIILFLSFILIASIIYCALFFDKDGLSPTVDMLASQPRSKTARQAGGKLVQISIMSLPGFLFIMGLAYIVFIIVFPANWQLSTSDYNISTSDALQEMQLVTTIAWLLIKSCILVILVVPGGMFLAILLGPVCIERIIKMKNMEHIEVELRVNKFYDMFFFDATDKLPTIITTRRNK